jgi:hypothetical protein
VTESEFAHKLRTASCILSILSRNRDFNPEKRGFDRALPASVGSEHERRRQTSATTNATCGKHENIERSCSQRIHH